MQHYTSVLEALRALKVSPFPLYAHLLYPPPSRVDPTVDSVVNDLCLLNFSDEMIEACLPYWKVLWVLLRLRRARKKRAPTATVEKTFEIPKISNVDLSALGGVENRGLWLQDSSTRPHLNAEGRDTLFGGLVGGKLRNVGGWGCIGTMVDRDAIGGIMNGGPPSELAGSVMVHQEKEEEEKEEEELQRRRRLQRKSRAYWRMAFNFELRLDGHLFTDLEDNVHETEGSSASTDIRQVEEEWLELHLLAPHTQRFARVDSLLKDRILLAFRRMVWSGKAGDFLGKLQVIDDIVGRVIMEGAALQAG